MFALVKDVEAYPDFLPWCKALDITERKKEMFFAHMVVGFRKMTVNFTSRVFCHKEDLKIIALYEKGPFKHLQNEWKFIPHSQGCTIRFYVEFVFRNLLLDMTFKVVSMQVMKRMIQAFETRAEKIYGAKHQSIL